MITLSELSRRAQNIIVTARVEETKSSNGKMLAQVAYTDRETGKEHLSRFLPVAIKNNKVLKLWMPVEKGEQVTVLRPFGDNDGGIIVPSLNWKGSREPVGANGHTAIVEFSDGCVIKYDTKTGRLAVNGARSIKLVATDIELVGTKSVSVVSPSFTHNNVNVGCTHTHGGSSCCAPDDDTPCCPTHDCSVCPKTAGCSRCSTCGDNSCCLSCGDIQCCPECGSEPCPHSLESIAS